MGDEIAHGVLGNERIAAISIASAATPNCMPSPTNAPRVRSTPKATTRDPREVISPESDGSEMKLEECSDLNDLSIFDISGGSKHSSRIGVTSSSSMSRRDNIVLSSGLRTNSPDSNGCIYRWRALRE